MDGDPDSIDLSLLAMFDGDVCVLGQRCPASILAAYVDEPGEEDRYFAYLTHLSEVANWDAGVDWASRHGFSLIRWDLKGQEAPDRWAALTAEWRRVICERRLAAGVTA